MDPLTVGLMVALEAIKARQQWWESLPQETKAELAERYAQGEIRILDFLDKVWQLLQKDKEKKEKVEPPRRRR